MAWERVVGTPSHRERGLGRGLCLPQITLNGVFWCILSGTFCSCPCQKNVEFSAGRGDLVEIEDAFFGNMNSLAVRIMGLIRFLLRCIVMQVIWCVKF